ncbi:MAG: hypothetical protein ACF8XB_16115 [Planctomycetota bacterium JB042]
MIHPVVRVALGVALLASPAAAIDPAIQVTVLTQEGQPVGAVGNVSSVANLAVNEAGAWIVEVDTDNANTNIDSVLIKNGVVLLQEGQLLPLPAGAGINTFDAVTLNDNDNSSWNLFLENTTGSSDDSGVYFNTTLLFQEGDLSTASAFSPGTTFRGFFETKLNDSDDTLLICSVDDPNISSTVDQALMLVTSSGVQTVLVKEGDSIPGVVGPLVTTFSTSPHNFDLNDAGDWIANLDTDDVSSSDGFILLNGAVFEREGNAAPVAGRLWSSLSGAELSINNEGDVVHSGSMDGDSSSNTIIALNGEKFRQEGDTLPGLSGFTFTSFGSGPILVADRGAPSDFPDVVWYGDWNDSDTSIDTGLFLDEKLLLQEGVDQIGGVTIEDVRGIQDGYAMSDDGRYIVAELNLVGSLDTAVLLDLGPWEKLGNGLAATTAPKLRAFGQLAGNTPTTVRLTNGVPNGTANLIIGLSQANVPLLGGTLVPNPDVIVFGLPIDANGTLEFTANWPAGVPAGTMVTMQYWNDDAGAPFSYSASNAVVGTSQ